MENNIVNKNGAKSTNGWSRKNFIFGILFVVGGIILFFVDFYLAYLRVGDSERAIPGWVYGLNLLSIAMALFGVLGFWLVIPAFEKWWHTKKWLALIFLIVGIFAGLLFFALHPIYKSVY
jgi:hypothetical protein